MTQEIVAISRRDLGRAGDKAAWRSIEFFTANTCNRNTRAAYAKAATQFFKWCDQRGLGLNQLNPTLVAAYIEQHPGSPTIGNTSEREPNEARRAVDMASFAALGAPCEN